MSNVFLDVVSGPFAKGIMLFGPSIIIIGILVIVSVIVAGVVIASIVDKAKRNSRKK